ncbi:MAG: hypothetical protein LZ161_01670 [Thaumarchaeota archaeon]|jgi:hypothetical protein|nr:hypothetical protein [Candidatus Terraquivivens yellowstonensis]MCL7394919.1 hypothetical protein [Candidatus Terraquivivens yellowstonensis]
MCGNKKGEYILEMNHVEELELKILKLPRPIKSVEEYINDVDLKEQTECVMSVKMPPYLRNWEEVEMMVYEMGFEVVEWHTGDTKDLVLVNKIPF